MSNIIKFARIFNVNTRLASDVKLPTRGTEFSAGIDFYAPHDFEIQPNSDVLIPSGLKCKIPENTVLIVFNKSGVSTKKKLITGACVIDEDYQGQLHLHLFNLSSVKQTFKKGDKVVQCLLMPIIYAEVIEAEESFLFENISERGEGGFGSTGS